MVGTFGGALEARHIDASNGKLVAEVTGEVETEEGFSSSAASTWPCNWSLPSRVREIVERVHGIYAMRCPLYRTLHKAIQLTSSYTLSAPPRFLLP